MCRSAVFLLGARDCTNERPDKMRLQKKIERKIVMVVHSLSVSLSFFVALLLADWAAAAKSKRHSHKAIVLELYREKKRDWKPRRDSSSSFFFYNESNGYECILMITIVTGCWVLQGRSSRSLDNKSIVMIVFQYPESTLIPTVMNHSMNQSWKKSYGILYGEYNFPIFIFCVEWF